MDRQPLLLEERKAIVLRTGTDPARPKGSCLTLAIDEEHLARLLVDPVDLVFAAWEPLMFIGAPNIEDHARAVCRDIAELLTRCIDPLQDGQDERCLAALTVGLEPPLNNYVHLSSQRAARRVDLSPHPPQRRTRTPFFRGRQ